MGVQYRYLDMAIKLKRELGIDDFLEIVDLADRQHDWSMAMTLDEVLKKLPTDCVGGSYQMPRQLAWI